MTAAAIDDGPVRAAVGELRLWMREAGWWPWVAVVAFLSHLAWLGFATDAPLRAMVLRVVQPGFVVAAVASLWMAARDPALDRQARQAWGITATSAMIFLVGGVLRVMESRARVVPGHLMPSDVPFFFGYLTFFAGLARFPRARRSRADSVKAWLDVAIVTVAGAAVLWHVAVAPALQLGPTTFGRVLFVTLYPACDVVLLYLAASALLSEPLPACRRALQFVACSALTLLCGDVLMSYAVARGAVQTFLPLEVECRQLALVLWILGAQHQRWIFGHGGGASPGAGVAAPFGASTLPYLAVAIGFGLFVASAHPYWAPLGPTLVAVLVLTALVLLRQFTAVRENAGLLTERIAREAHFRALVQNSFDVICVTDAAGVITYMSPAIAQRGGLAPGAYVGRPILEFAHRDDAEVLASVFARCRAGEPVVGPFVWRARVAGLGWRYLESVATRMLDDPAVRGIVINTRDVSDRVALQAELRHQAYHDPLTKLSNRAWFNMQVGQALARAVEAPESVAVFFLDLDNFKTVNDSLGHSAGDAFLTEVAARLLNATRGSDTVARLGGDEFAVLVARVGSAQALATIADRITNAMRAPVVLGGTELYAGVSIGIARAAPGDDADALLRHADVAMYVTKRNGKGAYTFYDPAPRRSTRSCVAAGCSPTRDQPSVAS